MTTINVVKQSYGENFLMIVPNIRQLKSMWTDEIIKQGVTWRIKVAKEMHYDEAYLGIYLYCINSDKSSKWSNAATASFKLYPWHGKESAIVKHLRPFVFSCSNNANGFGKFIDWDTLCGMYERYVQGDAIRMILNIEADKSDENEKSVLVFEHFDKCCGNVGQAKFRLTIKNVQNLMALRTSAFRMRGIPWYLTVFKHMNQLGISLDPTVQNIDCCQMRMLVKLISSKAGNTVLKSIEKRIKNRESLTMDSLMPWYELLHMDNRFMTDNAIIIHIELYDEDEPEEMAPKAKKRKKNSEDEYKPLECPVCYHTIGSQPVSFTSCGHLFCTPCITNAVERLRMCPTCQTEINMNSVNQAFLPL